MKRQLLIIGQGNIGTFIGLALNQCADNDVFHFVKNKDLKPKNIVLNFSDRRNTSKKIKQNSVYTYQQTDNKIDIANADFIFIPVRNTQWKITIEELKNNLSKNQVVIICGNVLDDFEWFEKNNSCPYLFAFPNFGGVIIDEKLQGWLTSNFTIGMTNELFKPQLDIVSSILVEVGFRPRKENDIRGWLMTHFAYNAGMLSAAAEQDGFQKMTKSFQGLKKMYISMQQCVNTVKAYGIEVTRFSEGRSVYAPLWWNVIKTYFLFLLPGLAKSVDASKDKNEWMSYLKSLKDFAIKNKLSLPK